MRKPKVGERFKFYNNPSIYRLTRYENGEVSFICEDHPEDEDWFVEDAYRFLRELDSGYLAKWVEEE